jgi:spore maturation protein CgeB
MEELNQIAARGRQAVLNNHTYGHRVEQMIATIEEAINKNEA